MNKFYRKTVIVEEASKTSDGFPLAEGSHPIREHEECGWCKGSGQSKHADHCSLGRCVKDHPGITCHPKGVRCEYYVHLDLPCPHCLKDAEDKPTGAEPGTATEWRVRGELT